MRFLYTAKSLKGKKEEGLMEAEDEFKLAKILKQKGLILISAQQDGKIKKERLKINILISGRVSLVEKMMFTKNLGVMVSAGVPLNKALETLSMQTKNKRFAETILDIEEELMAGKSFSDALLNHPDIFPEIFCSMVKVGEEGGKLEEVLLILTRQMEREHELKSKVKGALMYPAVIILAMIGIGVLMLVMVVPKLAETFKEFNASLPASTKFVIWLGQAVAARWYLLIVAAAVLPILFSVVSKSKTGKRVFDALNLKIPIISPIIKKVNSAYTSRILSSLIASGVPIARSLEILGRSLGNSYYQQALETTAEEVRKGGTVSKSLESYQNLYPLLLVQMVAVGEETGQMSEVLEKLADFFEGEAADASKNLATVIEPIVMLIVGGAVGFFAISMIQPMYSMMDAIK